MGNGVSHEGGRVDGQHLRTLLHALQACGYDALRFLNGAAGRRKELAHPRAEVTLEELVELVERVAQARGQGELLRVAKAFAALHPTPRLLSGYLLSPRHFFRALGGALASSPCCRFEYHEHDGAIDFSVELDKVRAPSRAFLEALGLVLAALAEALGQPGTSVTVLDLAPPRACFRVLVGPGRGLLKVSEPQLSAIVSHVLYLGARQRPVAARAPVPSVAVLEERFGLTRAEARVARRLAMGRSLKHISKELDISPETARTHAKRAMQKTQTHRQAELVSVVLGLERG
ncbi:MAG: hypothetical protein AMXMBFR34_18000 [Myxococcaceae bacterium]